VAVERPYKRACRPFVSDKDGGDWDRGDWQYITHPEYAKEPQHYVRAFELIQKDLLEIFDYVEPSDTNLSCYSYRIHALHMRTCIEVEANCKAILEENEYSKEGDLNMTDYKKLEHTHHLSAYEVIVPNWDGKRKSRMKPFESWRGTAKSLDWYQAYNEAKHDRQAKFAHANLESLLEAVCGLVALLSSQFWLWSFSPSGMYWKTQLGGLSTGFNVAIGGYFHVRFPANFAPAEQYDFDWDSLKHLPNPIDKIRQF
jgi:hypothetical protein